MQRTSELEYATIPTVTYNAVTIPKAQVTSWKKGRNTIRARGPGYMLLDNSFYTQQGNCPIEILTIWSCKLSPLMKS